jgi:hypothetical protein
MGVDVSREDDARTREIGAVAEPSPMSTGLDPSIHSYVQQSCIPPGVAARNPSSEAGRTLRAITYGRVSTGRQAATGVSLGDQEETLAAVVAQRGWEHVEHVTDPGFSAKKMSNRRVLLDAPDRLDRGEAEVLVASKVDRVSRSTKDFSRLLTRAERHGWSVVVLYADLDTTTAAGRLVVEIISAAALVSE